MCVTVTTYSEHPCGAVIFSGRSHVSTLFSLKDGLSYILKPIRRLIVVELPAREVIVTLDSTLTGLALQHASNRKHEIIDGGGF